MIRDVVENVLNLLYPKRCVICRVLLEPGAEFRLCERCIYSLRPNPKPWCVRCCRPIGCAGKMCAECRKRRYSFESNYSPYLYDGAMRLAIHHFKYRQKAHLAKLFAKLLIAFLKENAYIIEDVQGIVPVPLSRARFRERGYNQSELLAGPIAKEFALPIFDVLKKNRSTPTQSGLGREARARNIKSAFALRDRNVLTGKKILIIDDVFTTGSTIDECSRVLLGAGAREVLSLTLARGESLSESR